MGPEAILLNESENLEEKFDFDPRKMRDQSLTEFKPECEVVMMVGLPGCGKSTLSRMLENDGYRVVNQDTLKTKAKCLSEFRKIVAQSGAKVVVDNTNTNVKVREEYLQICKSRGMAVEAVQFEMNFKRIQHNALFRHYLDPPNNPLIATMVMNTIKKNYTPPDQSEGFTKITKLT